MIEVLLDRTRYLVLVAVVGSLLPAFAAGPESGPAAPPPKGEVGSFDPQMTNAP